MKIAVIGAGAVGAVTAAAAGGHHEVTVCARSPIEELELQTGEGSAFPSGPLAVRLVSSPDELAEPADAVFVTVKATDNSSVVPWLARLCRDGTLVGVVQNGLDQEQRLASAVPAGAVIFPALAYLAAERLAAGKVRHLSGNLMAVPAAVAPVVQGLLPLMEVRGETDMATACWRKLLANLIANPITALTMRRIGVMAEPGIADLSRGLLHEAVTVGRASGADLSYEEADRIVSSAARWGPDTGSSMLYDRLAGRPTEHEFITGEVVRRGRAAGLEVPLNAAVLALLQALDSGRDQIVTTL